MIDGVYIFFFILFLNRMKLFVHMLSKCPNTHIHGRLWLFLKLECTVAQTHVKESIISMFAINFSFHVDSHYYWNGISKMQYAVCICYLSIAIIVRQFDWPMKKIYAQREPNRLLNNHFIEMSKCCHCHFEMFELARQTLNK